MRLILCLLFSALTFAGQPGWNYSAYKETVLAAASEAISIQQPSGGSRNIYIDGIAVYCSVDCEFTIERGGTAATTTALTASILGRSAPAPIAQTFYSSNAGAGTETLSKYSVTAGSTVPISMAGLAMPRGGGGDTVTVRTSTITGTVRVIVRWTEVQ